MHEIELKAHLEHPEKTEELLSHFAVFSSRCIKNDRYWSIGEKTLRIRRQQADGKETVLITHKLKKYSGTIETNQELEFELPVSAVSVFTAMLEQIGFTCTAKKQKDTKVYTPHQDLFGTEVLTDVKAVSVELSVIEPLGSFLEIEVLYPDEKDTAAAEQHVRNAQVIFDTLLSALEIPQAAIEARPYNELLALF